VLSQMLRAYQQTVAALPHGLSCCQSSGRAARALKPWRPGAV
jgi:hypothetical protein